MATAKYAVDIKELLKAGSQFGHETKRWNPKMAKFIYGDKNDIHIIDISQTQELLSKAADALEKLAATGTVMFVGTKRQAVDIVKKYSIESGSYFMVNRWVGGFFTNFRQVKRSLQRLRDLETMFESGIEGRTKYEISRMKVEWQRLNRLYAGVKTMEKWPVAVVVIDPRYERAAVLESRRAGIPVFALADTNCDPSIVDYIIPANDDALGSIELVVKTFAGAIKAGNGGKGITHELKDYAPLEVKIIKQAGDTEELAKVELLTVSESPKPAEEAVAPKKKVATKKASNAKLEGGILGRSRSKKA